MLVLLDTLIMFGYYTNKKQCVDLIHALEKLVDGTDDAAVGDVSYGSGVSGEASRENSSKVGRLKTAGSPPALPPSNEEWRGKHRYEKSIENEILVNTKCAALDCIDTMIDMAMTTRLQRLLSDFKRLKENGSIQGHGGVKQFLKYNSPVNDDSR